MKLKWIIILIESIFLMSCANLPSPATKRSLYQIVIRIESNSNVQIDAYVYDEYNIFVNNATMSVDGQSLVKQPSVDLYYVQINKIWSDGSSHSFSVSTPDGKSSSGNIVKPTGILTGFTVNPPSNTGVNTYTVSPPSGSWPTGSYIRCTFENGGVNYWIPKSPSGKVNEMFTSSHLVGATSLDFKGALQNKVSIDNYNPYSIVTLTGPFTSW